MNQRTQLIITSSESKSHEFDEGEEQSSESSTSLSRKKRNIS